MTPDIVLECIRALGSEAYGVTLRREIEHRAGKNISLGWVYATCDRLEEDGFIESRTEPGGPERGGRPKKVWRVTG